MEARKAHKKGKPRKKQRHGRHVKQRRIGM